MIDLKALMSNNSISQRTMAEIMDTTQSEVSKIANGRRTILRKHLQRLIDFFGEEQINRYTIPEELPQEIPHSGDAQLYGPKRGDDILNAITEEIAALRREIFIEREKKDSQMERMLDMMNKQAEQQNKLIDYITKDR